MYAIKYLEEAVDELAALDLVTQKRIKEKIDLLGADPSSLVKNIKPLKGKHKGKARLKVGNYRVIFKKEEEHILILIVRIGHRKDVYL